MHRLFYFLAVMAFAALGAEESKEKPNPLLSLDRLYGKPEFSAKSYGVKWLEEGRDMCGWRNPRRQRRRGILCGWIRRRGSERFWLRPRH